MNVKFLMWRLLLHRFILSSDLVLSVWFFIDTASVSDFSFLTGIKSASFEVYSVYVFGCLFTIDVFTSIELKTPVFVILVTI